MPNPTENKEVNKSSGGRGFAGMGKEQQQEIASKGGRAAHESGHAHEFDSQEAAEAGRKGGESVSQDRQHMAEIGAEGGRASGGGGGQSGQGSGQQTEGSTRGGSSEQHARAGSQSHKND